MRTLQRKRKAKHYYSTKPKDGEVIDFETMADGIKFARQAFVREYMKDFCGTAAILRLGYTYAQPAKVARDWLNEPYTQYYLQEMLDKAEANDLFSRSQVVAGLAKEATAPDKAFVSNSTTRIAALRALAKIKGMEITRTEGTLSVSGGVMAVPLAKSVEEWEAVTVQAQEKLKAEVRK